MRQSPSMGEGSDASASRRPRFKAIDGAIAFVLVASAILPVAARLAAMAPEAVPSAGSDLPPLRRSPTAELRDVPVFAPGGDVQRAVDEGGVLVDAERMATGLQSATLDLLPFGDGASALAALVADSALTPTLFDPLSSTAQRLPDPYLHPPIDALLDRVLPGPLDPARSAAASDLAGLLTVAAARFPDRFTNGAAVAYELLERARATGACDPELNLAALLALDPLPWDDDVAAAFERAAAACRGEATPLWLLGQYQSHLAFFTQDARLSLPPSLGADPRRAERLRRPFDTFRRLQRDYPGSPAGWSGEGDLQLRLAYAEARFEPFTARGRFRRALELYRRARALSDEPGLAAGEAKAQAGLGRFDLAIGAQREAIAAQPGSMVFQAGMIEHLEGAKRFGQAADAAAASLAGPAELPTGRGLFPEGFSQVADSYRPLSVGTERLNTALLLVVSSGGRGAGAGVEDLSFLPTFRDSIELTGSLPWCRDWSRRRDLVLAERTADALQDFPPSFAYDGPGPLAGSPCYSHPFLLEAVARLETGDEAGAAAVVARAVAEGSTSLRPYEASADPAMALVQDARQNLWRFGGGLGRAASAVEKWLAADPNDPLALDRTGETAFLSGEPQDAAPRFEAAATRWVAISLDLPDDGRATAAAATERVKLGAMLEKAGRPRDGLRQLSTADALAGIALQAPSPDDATRQEALVASYFARARSGDIELRRRRYDRAEAHYRAARDRLNELRADAEAFGMGLLRPEVLENNQALAEIRLGRPGSALKLATTAVDADPRSPIFLQTLAFAQQEGRDLDGAARSYAAAVDADPTLFPAMNDLGAVRALQGRNDEAARAFLDAIAVRPRFATAWFNLGVVRSRMGPGHLLESQGAFARASGLDRSLRDREREVIFDQDLYFTTLDLSKPLPPEWTFAKSEGRAPLGVSALLVILLLVRLAWSLGRDRAGAKGLERFAGLTEKPRFARLAWLVRPATVWVAMGATLLVLLWPLARAGGASPTEVLVLALGVVALLCLYVRARSLAVERRGVRLRHYSWVPAVAFGTVAMFVGFIWSPLPVSHRDEGTPVPWSGTLALGAATLLFLVLGTVSEVPIARALGVAGLVMTASALSPIPPYDGASLGKGIAAALDGLFVGVAVLLFLRVL